MTEKIINLTEERNKRSESKRISELVKQDLTEMEISGTMNEVVNPLAMAYQSTLISCLYLRKTLEERNIND